MEIEEKSATVDVTLSVARELYKSGGIGRKFALNLFKEEDLTRGRLPKRWQELPNISGFYLDGNANVTYTEGRSPDKPSRIIFFTEKQAKSSRAMSMLSQLLGKANGEWEPNWHDETQPKYVIARNKYEISLDLVYTHYHFLAFRDRDLRDEFYEKYEALIEEHFMF